MNGGQSEAESPFLTAQEENKKLSCGQRLNYVISNRLWTSLSTFPLAH